MATNNFLDLTALAAYGERQVVLPFVKNSFFFGEPTKEGFETLALYYNVSALNRASFPRSWYAYKLERVSKCLSRETGHNCTF